MSSAARTSALTRPAGLVFDMDGTLTLPHAIDFALMRRLVGVPPGQDILAYIDSQPSSDERARLLGLVVQVENAGLDSARLQPHCHELLRFLHDNSIPRALVTRNNHMAMEHTIGMLESGGVAMPVTDAGSPSPSPMSPGWASPHFGPPFSIMLSRSFTPCKPHPAPVLHICEQWGVHPSSIWFIGDHSDDMQCARAAGAWGVLIGDDAQAQGLAHEVVATLEELKELVKAHL